MRKGTITRREFLRLGAAAGGAWVLAACTGGSAGSPSETRGSGGIAVGPVQGGQVVTDPSRFPTTFNEAPELAELVSQGKLPPVAQRIGQDPLVVEPLEGIGRYGGVLRRGFIGTVDFQNSNRFNAGPDSLLYWDYRWQRVIPNIARGFEMSPDGRELVLLLRRGMHWSDGHPFTADDIVFWWEDIYRNRDLVPAPTPALQVEGRDVVVEKVDDHTVRFVSPGPNFILPQQLAGWSDVGGQSGWGPRGLGGYAPKHYLSGFHPKYVSQREADRLAREAGFDGWTTFFLSRNDWNSNRELPVLAPWRVVRPITEEQWVFERNPYSIWVDTEGNQLPYIGTIIYSLAQDIEVVNLRAVAGEYDFQDRHLGVTNIPVLLRNQRRGGYKVHLDPGQVLDFGIRINLAYDKDPVIGDLLRNVAFRRALSLAVDRDQINEVFFLGTSVPTATVPPDDNKYFPGPEWRTKWAVLDPDQANELLDGIGLTDRDDQGFRLRPDGKGRLRLGYTVTTGFADFAGIGEMLRDQWRAIGIDLDVESVDGTLIVERALANDIQLSGHTVGSEDPFLSPDTVIPFSTNSYFGMMGIPFAVWLRSGGASGVEPFQEIKDAWDLYIRGLSAPDEERIELGKQLFMLHADQVFTIGVVGFGYGIYGVHVAKENLGNVPARYINALPVKTPSNALPMTLFYRE
ncbi:MAG TPA: ABC transporter substrate-binding protein [Actinomycetota bacterium]|nr:ABC transporter substrate-binding protein [Actinomycetota bacterium]